VTRPGIRQKAMMFPKACNENPASRSFGFRFPGCFAIVILAASIQLDSAAQTEIQYLSGTDKDHTVPWRFYLTGGGRSNNVWTTIPVPSCWQTKGFGNYGYGTGANNGGSYNATSKSVGEYRTTFSVPQSWAGKKIYLVFEGVFTDTSTKINGQLIAGTATNTVVTLLPPNTNAVPDDRAFDNSASTSQGGTGGIASSGNTVNLGTVNQLTLCAWIKPSADFSTMDNAAYPRFIMVGSSPTYDTSQPNGVALLGFNDSTLSEGMQLAVNTSSVNSSGGILTGNDWLFIAVTYNSTLANNNVNFYVGSRTSPVTLVSTRTLSQGPVAFGANAYAFLLNRSSHDRAFDGWGDDFRIFTNALNQTALDAVRVSALSNSAPTAATAQYQWNFNTATTGTDVPPNIGAGGVLTFKDSSNTITNLYSAVGLGVSGAATNYTTNTIVTSTAHQGGWYQFSYDVTTNVVVGTDTNVLDVTVAEWSANSSINSAEREADYWNYSGIFRPVYLMAKPQSNIKRLAVDAQADGRINVNVFLCGITNSALVIGSVTDSNGIPLGAPFTNAVSAGSTSTLLSAVVPTPQPWSSEFPNLYTLTVQLADENGNPIHMVTNLIGFRTLTFSNNVGFFVNGKKVVLRGVNRHEFWPNDGRTTSRAESDLDIKLIKGMNMNAVRMSHYPPNKVFLEECDRLGLYVLDELGGWQHAYDNAVASNLVREMVVRDVNHPCIIAWDNGNEGGWNTTVDHNGVGSTNVYAIYDPQNRPVNRPGYGANFDNIYDVHYPSWSTFSGALGAGKTAFMPTEILHALYDGGAGASLSDYWNALRTAPNGAGMFTWAFLDEGLVRDDLGGAIDVQDQCAPDGIVGPYRQPEASYYTYKAIYNPVQITPPDPTVFNGTLAVENRFDFTSLNQCQFDWQLGWFPDPNDSRDASTNALTGGFLVALDSGDFAGPAIAPGASGSLNLPNFPVNVTNFDAVRLTVTDPFGNNLYTWTFPLHSPAQIRDRIMPANAATVSGISAGTTATEIVVTNGAQVFRFNKANGILNGLTVSNSPVSLTNGPNLVAGSWNTASVTNYFDGTNYVVMVNNINASPNAFEWILRPDGWVRLIYRYTLTGSQSYMGITFDYPSNEVVGMNWLGQGPYRAYKNRIAGQEIFVHTKPYNYTWTGQSTLIAPTTTQWVYPEFEGYYGQLHWAVLHTTEQPIAIVTPTTNLFFRVLTPPVTDNANVNPPYPSGGISFLHGIPPQGAKFHSISTYGPSASLNMATGPYSGEVDFFFGQTAPAAPTGLNASAGNAQVNLSWNAVAGATSYNVKRSTASGKETTIANVGEPHFADGGLDRGTTYYYVVSAVNGVGESADSSEIGVTPPTSPNFTAIALSGTTLTLSATNGTSGGDYRLLMTTNVALPLSQWTPVLTNVFDSDGNLNLSTNIVNPEEPERFYILQVQ
jgi:beta-galactosidase/beta-glucuronidase